MEILENYLKISIKDFFMKLLLEEKNKVEIKAYLSNPYCKDIDNVIDNLTEETIDNIKLSCGDFIDNIDDLFSTMDEAWETEEEFNEKIEDPFNEFKYKE